MSRYCSSCGAQLPQEARYCASCGRAAPTATARRGADGDDAATAPYAAVGEPTRPADAEDEPRGTLREHPATSPLPSRPEPPGASSATISAQFAAWPDDARPVRDAGSAGAAGGDRWDPLGAGSTGDVPARRRKPTWPVLVLLAVVVLACLAWAFSSLRGGGPTGPMAAVGDQPSTLSGVAPGGSPAVPSAPSGPNDPSGTSGTGGTSESANADAQAARIAVAQVLDAGRGSRSTLVQGYDAYCSKSDKAGGTRQINEALQGRMAQLAKLNDVGEAPFANVRGGIVGRDKLKTALQASAAADQVYVAMASAGTVCQGSAELTRANAAASTAKKDFLDTWNPIMTEAKLQPFGNDDL